MGGDVMARVNKGARGGPAPGRVRIIGGHLRGSVLDVPDRPGLRPTPNRLRETLFNWLQPTLAGAACLDLFAGSGALGLEALSRGAGALQLVERDAGLAAALRANLARLCPDRGAQVHTGDACSFLGSVSSRRFDVVFIDPPFATDLWNAVAEQLEDGVWLAPQARVYLEMPAGKRVAVPSTWTLEREKNIGGVHATLYRRQPDPLS